MTEIQSLPVIVDVFCGAGGEFDGIWEAAQKAGVLIKGYAINHWKRAIETHQANFPDAEHICRDIQDINPSEIVPGRRIAMLWMSPECIHHSNARGGKPMDNQSRCSAFTLFDWLNKMTVDRVIVENVPEFESWGPLDEKTKRPIKDLKGDTFRAWVGMIRSFDYTVDWQVLNAADFGAPTTRRRLFVQAVRNGSGKSILWPEPSHAKHGLNRSLTEELPGWVPASQIIDWTLPTQIIDERKKPLAANTMKRILRGIEKYWGPYARPFLVRYNGGENRVHSVDDPLPVCDTSNRYGLVQPLITCIGQTSSKGRTRRVSDPLQTVVTKEEACLIEPLFVPQQSCGEVRPTTGPLSTVATKGAISVVEPLIVEYHGNGGCHPVSKPIPTLDTNDRFALITPENIRLGFRMLKPHELAAAQSFPRDYIFTGNRGEIVKQIGNAVCPKIAEALTSNYMRELAGASV
ncbi:MAG: DNA cytosine methyltransferase [Methanoregula sp.]|nr:DNA cytosine methyltransferase [Methanoregula sp.]